MHKVVNRVVILALIRLMTVGRNVPIPTTAAIRTLLVPPSRFSARPTCSGSMMPSWQSFLPTNTPFLSYTFVDPREEKTVHSRAFLVTCWFFRIFLAVTIWLSSGVI